MSHSHRNVAVEAARAYHELFVPALFDQWPNTLLDKAQVKLGDRFLDVACGTGVLAGAAEQRVGAEGSVTAIDVHAGMVEVGRQLFSNITWRVGDATDLPFPNQSFDVVGCQFGLMFFPDTVQAIREMHRVLKPNGRLLLLVWDHLENNPVFQDLVDLLHRMAGEDAANAIRLPFGMGDPSQLRSFAQQAGVEAPSIETLEGKGRFDSFRTLVEADLRGWLPVMGVHLEEELIQEIITVAVTELAHHSETDDVATFPVSAHLVHNVGRSK